MTDSQQQQFCLRWNNFQANITSQFEALRDDEDFVDVTFACDGRRLQAHKVVLSACSPYFKELFKTNPCKHPIIFMRDVEFEHLQSLLEFMYAGEVNISQAELPTFLRTAESLQIRGLTDSQNNQHNNEKHSKTNNVHTSNGRGLISPSFDDERSKTPPPATSPPPLKRLCKRSDSPINSSPVPATPPAGSTGTTRNRPLTIEPQVQLDCYKDLDIVEPKVELPEYGSDDECSPKQEVNTLPGGFLSLDGGMEVLPTYPPSYAGSGIEGGLPGPSHGSTTELNQEQQAKGATGCGTIRPDEIYVQEGELDVSNIVELCDEPSKPSELPELMHVSDETIEVMDYQVGTSGTIGPQVEMSQTNKHGMMKPGAMHIVKPFDAGNTIDTEVGGEVEVETSKLEGEMRDDGASMRRATRIEKVLSETSNSEDEMKKKETDDDEETTDSTESQVESLSPETRHAYGLWALDDSDEESLEMARWTTTKFYCPLCRLDCRRVRRGRPRLGTRGGGRHLSSSVHGNSPLRNDWLPGPLDMSTTTMPAFRGFEESASDGVVHLGEGIAVCEEQLRAVKWSDYRKLTRGLAAILFSPTELATCSVTGQRWSRAGTATERPVKPALDRAKVQAIISYVTSRFPSVDVSSVKQVLAYKCKENSTALKMKSIRYICERQDTETSASGETGEDK